MALVLKTRVRKHRKFESYTHRMINKKVLIGIAALSAVVTAVIIYNRGSFSRKLRLYAKSYTNNQA